MKIGIIGGGQLALMMIQESPEHSYFVIDPNKNCPASKETPNIIVAKYDDINALEELYKNCDVITYEFENIPSKALSIIEDKLFPNSKILEISQNRLKEKNLAQSLGIPTPRFFAIENIKDYENAINQFEGKAILKSVSGGYDGKGQILIKNKIISEDIKDLINNGTCILEVFVDFKFETSIVANRDKKGNVVFLPNTLNVHRNGILFTTSNLETIAYKKLLVATKRIMNELDVVGTLTVEYFETDYGFVFNELAPRPHNSGHWSIEGSTVSQFRNHILAVTGQEVIVPEKKKFTIMVNLLGEEFTKAKKNIDFNENIILHDYYKEEVREGRKMGHITIISDSKQETTKLADYVIERIK